MDDTNETECNHIADKPSFTCFFIITGTYSVIAKNEKGKINVNR